MIPTSMPAGKALNCEDAVAIGDATLRKALARLHPQGWARIEARRAFLKNTLGVDLAEHLLPLSNIQLCLPPLWLKPERIFVRG